MGLGDVFLRASGVNLGLGLRLGLRFRLGLVLGLRLGSRLGLCGRMGDACALGLLSWRHESVSSPSQETCNLSVTCQTAAAQQR